MKRFNILVVDDDPNVVQALRRGFTKVGAIVETATDGLQCVTIALEKWACDEIFDAIILDLRMPGLDGLTVSRTLRAEGYPGLIICLSGELHRSCAVESWSAGMDSHMCKPASVEEILDTIANCLLLDN